MNIKSILYFIFYILYFTSVAFGEDLPLKVKAPSAILIDANTGYVFFEKNADTKYYPASITKIMTGMLLVKYGDLEKKITVSRKAAYSIERGSSSIALKPGEKVTLKDVLYGLMLRSANECGNIISEEISGSFDKFAALMTSEAKKIGCVNTTFKNAHGLHHPEHQTTARDMALIGAHAMEYKAFVDSVKTKFYPFPDTNKHKAHERGKLRNKNKLLFSKKKEFFEMAEGIKAGFTRKSLHTFVGSALSEKNRVIAVVMKERNKKDMYSDINNLLRFGLTRFKKKNLSNKNELYDVVKINDGIEKLTINYESDMKTVLPDAISDKDIIKNVNLLNIEAPIKKGATLGSVSYHYKNKFLGEVNLIAGNDVMKYLGKKHAKKIAFSFPAIVGYCCILSLIVLLIPINKKKKKKRIKFHLV